MLKSRLLKLALAFAGFVFLAAALYQLPPIKNRLDWRIDFAATYLRGAINPAGALPTALPRPQIRSVTISTPTERVVTRASDSASLSKPTTAPPTPSPTLSPTPLPASASLPAPVYEKQDINNCGPATLTMLLRYYGWEGTQEDIAAVIKPFREDRNVNVEELDYFVRNYAGWLNIVYRVGGDLERLKALLAAGFPVIIEESFYFEETYWPDDDQWAAHYNLVTGYDDASRTFTVQDSFYGADLKVSYKKLDDYWQSFNRVYFLPYLPEQEAMVKSILGEDWDADANRQHALEVAQAEAERNPENAFAWFNVGTNLVYFERWEEAAQAYDMARNLGLPQRMLRYQFGPFFAYFHSGRNEDLLALTQYALQRTPNAEEARLWHGWALYREGDTYEAGEEFHKALEANPKYQDAQYAIKFLNDQQ